MNHASLFSGIGGPEVAAAMLGWKNVFHCEINPFGRGVLEYWFPDSVSYEDITKTDFRQWRGQIDVLTGGFPCQPFSYAGKRGGGRKTSVISGQKCSAQYQKSGPLGSLVRTLLESPLWSKEGFSLKWDVKQLCSARTTTFTDTNSDSPSPSNASAKTSKPSDTKSSRFLFRLRLVGLPIDETECFSSPIMLKTPTAFDGKSALPTSAAKTSSTGTLAQEIANGYAQKRGLILPTPETQGLKVNVKGQQKFIRLDLLPTPTAREGDKFTNTYNPNSQMGQSLSALAGSGLLPTPTARDYKNPSSPDGQRIARKEAEGYTIELSDLATMGLLPTPSARDYQPPYNPDAMVRKNGMVRNDQLSTLPTMLGLKERGGISFRLSPLFTQEMMGFPLGWTEFPFLPQCTQPNTETPTAPDSISASGETNPSKPTATP